MTNEKPGVEVMVANPAIRSLIREDKAHQIYSVIQTSGKIGMKTMNSEGIPPTSPLR